MKGECVVVGNVDIVFTVCIWKTMSSTQTVLIAQMGEVKCDSRVLEDATKQLPTNANHVGWRRLHVAGSLQVRDRGLLTYLCKVRNTQLRPVSCLILGSGKTLAYVAPMLQHIVAQNHLLPNEGPVALILLPMSF